MISVKSSGTSERKSFRSCNRNHGTNISHAHFMCQNFWSCRIRNIRVLSLSHCQSAVFFDSSSHALCVGRCSVYRSPFRLRIAFNGMPTVSEAPEAIIIWALFTESVSKAFLIIRTASADEYWSLKKRCVYSLIDYFSQCKSDYHTALRLSQSRFAADWPYEKQNECWRMRSRVASELLLINTESVSGGLAR